MKVCYLSYKRTYAGVNLIKFYVGMYLVAYILMASTSKLQRQDLVNRVDE